MNPNTFNAVRGIVAEALGVAPKQVSEEDTVTSLIERYGREDAEPTSEQSYVDDLGAEFLYRAEIMIALETEFTLEIPNDEAQRITGQEGKAMTIRDMADFVDQKRAQ